MARKGTGKGETVRQERTSARGDPGGSANPTRSKAEQGTDARPVPPRRHTPQVGRIDGWPPRRLRATHRTPPTGRLTVHIASEQDFWPESASSGPEEAAGTPAAVQARATAAQRQKQERRGRGGGMARSRPREVTSSGIRAWVAADMRATHRDIGTLRLSSDLRVGAGRLHRGPLSRHGAGVQARGGRHVTAMRTTHKGDMELAPLDQGVGAVYRQPEELRRFRHRYLVVRRTPRRRS